MGHKNKANKASSAKQSVTTAGNTNNASKVPSVSAAGANLAASVPTQSAADTTDYAADYTPAGYHAGLITVVTPGSDKLQAAFASADKQAIAQAASEFEFSRYEDRKSVFLGHIKHVETAQEVDEFVAQIRQANPAARHVTHAAVLSSGSGMERMSDDGEPQGTAGRQILDIIRKKGLSDVVCTVTRYFGGILLGAGGLVRAYASTAAQALDAVPQAQLALQARFELTVNYSQQRDLDHILDSLDATVISRNWAENVESLVGLDPLQIDTFRTRIRDSFAGAVTPVQLMSEPTQVPVKKAD